MSSPLILLIEDNREVRMSARFVLEDHGFNLIEQENPVQAMAYLQQHSADIILLDMNFALDTTSGDEGLRFLRWLQQQQLNIPVVAMTAWSNTALTPRYARVTTFSQSASTAKTASSSSTQVTLLRCVWQKRSTT